MADSDSSVTILPDGRLGKCEHESERLLVGNIYDGVTDGEMLDRWKERVKVPACRACPLAPACNRLRMCAWTGGECTEADRARIRLSLEQSVLNEYRRYRDRGGKLNETETNVDFPAFGR